MWWFSVLLKRRLVRGRTWCRRLLRSEPCKKGQPVIHPTIMIVGWKPFPNGRLMIQGIRNRITKWSENRLCDDFFLVYSESPMSSKWGFSHITYAIQKPVTKIGENSLGQSNMFVAKHVTVRHHVVNDLYEIAHNILYIHIHTCIALHCIELHDVTLGYVTLR